MLIVLPFIVNGKRLSERNKDSHGEAEMRLRESL